MNIEENFISRIDGTIKNKKDFPPTINEGGQLSENLPNLFQISRDVEYLKNVKNAKIALKSMYNYSDEIIDKISEHFESVDESLYFIEIFDEYNNFNDSWKDYCIRRDIKHEMDNNPFI